MASGSYMNMWPYHKLFPSNVNWTKPVESFGVNLAHRYKPSSSAIWKNYFYADFGNMGYSSNESDNTTFTLNNSNQSLYFNSSYKDFFEKSCYKFDSPYEANNTELNGFPSTQEISADGRLLLSSGRRCINAGINETFSQYNQDIFLPIKQNLEKN